MIVQDIEATSDCTDLGGGGGASNTPGNTPNSPFNVQLFPIALAKGQGCVALNGDAYGQTYKRGNVQTIGGFPVQTLTANAPNTSRCTRGYAFVPNSKMLAGSMGMIFRQVTGASNFRFYLFKLVGSAPEVIAMTARFTPVLNLQVVPFITPVEIDPLTMYYMGYYCDDATGNIQFLMDFFDTDITTSPILTCADANEQGIGGVIGIGTPTQFRPWMTLNESTP